MGQFSIPKVVLISILVIGVAGIGYAGLVIWQEKVSTGNRGDEDVVEHESPTEEMPLIESPSSQGEESPQVDTSDWKTFTHAKYKYSLKYPPTYSLGSCTSCFDIYNAEFITFDPPQSKSYGRIMITHLRDREQSETPTQYLDDMKGIDANPVIPGSTIRFKLNNVEALAISTTNFGYENRHVFLIEGRQGFDISFSGLNSSQNKGLSLNEYRNMTVFEQMLTTFQFISY